MTGKELRTKRQEVGLSQAKLSELAGVSQHLLSAAELGKTSLSSRILEGVLESLGDATAVSNLVTRAKRYQKPSHDVGLVSCSHAETIYSTSGNAQYRQILEDIWHHHTSDCERELSALSLFSGCGGFSLGFSAAGFAIKGCVESDTRIKQIYKANYPQTLDLGEDITQLDTSKLLAHARRIGEVDVIIGGPPCQGFSLAGKRHVADPRNILFEHYLKLVSLFRPKIAVLENVRLLSSMRNAAGGYVADDVAASFRSLGYCVRSFEVNAKSYGVPQHRERLFFMAARKDIAWEPEFPMPTHALCPDMFGARAAFRTFEDACSDLDSLESGEAAIADPLHRAVRHPAHVIKWLRDVPQGKSAHQNADPRNRPPSGYNTTYKRQVWNEPASTVQTTFGMISGCRNVHPLATRSLTIREAARIQSFPDQFHFEGTSGTIRTAIGNAVPPLLSYRLGLFLRQQLQRL